MATGWSKWVGRELGGSKKWKNSWSRQLPTPPRRPVLVSRGVGFTMAKIYTVPIYKISQLYSTLLEKVLHCKTENIVGFSRWCRRGAFFPPIPLCSMIRRWENPKWSLLPLPPRRPNNNALNFIGATATVSFPLACLLKGTIRERMEKKTLFSEKGLVSSILLRFFQIDSIRMSTRVPTKKGF